VKKGFATIYIVLILFSLTLTLLVISEVASGYGAESIAESICTSAGESVLGEYDLELYTRYGIFALNNDEERLSEKLMHYVSLSTKVTKGFVKIKAKDAFVYADKYPALNIGLFKRELNKVAVLGIAKPKLCIEEKAENKVSNNSYPSKLLGFSSRESILLSGGLFDLDLSTGFEDEYILKMCSNKRELLEDSYLSYEVEYILFGYQSDALNLASMKRSIYAIRFAIDLAKADPPPVDGVTLAVASAKAALDASMEVERILNGETIDGLDYKAYLRIFLVLLDSDEKLARLMDIMQININNVEGKIFSFKNCAFGFDIDVTFEKNVFVPIFWGNDKRYREVWQTHRYK